METLEGTESGKVGVGDGEMEGGGLTAVESTGSMGLGLGMKPVMSSGSLPAAVMGTPTGMSREDSYLKFPLGREDSFVKLPLGREDSYLRLPGMARDDSFFHLPSMSRENSFQNFLTVNGKGGGVGREDSIQNLVTMTRTSSFKDVLEDLIRKVTVNQRQGTNAEENWFPRSTSDQFAAKEISAVDTAISTESKASPVREIKEENVAQQCNAAPVKAESELESLKEDEKLVHDTDLTSDHELNVAQDGPMTDTDAENARLNDIHGTTAAKSRKMTAEEKRLMLHKRKLRNRQSAARSREKHRRMLQEVVAEIDQLSKRTDDVLQKCEQCAMNNQSIREENLQCQQENLMLKMHISQFLSSDEAGGSSVNNMLAATGAALWSANMPPMQRPSSLAAAAAAAQQPLTEQQLQQQLLHMQQPPHKRPRFATNAPTLAPYVQMRAPNPPPTDSSNKNTNTNATTNPTTFAFPTRSGVFPIPGGS